MTVESLERQEAGYDESVAQPEVCEPEGDHVDRSFSDQAVPEHMMHNAPLELSIWMRIYDWLDTRISRLSTRNNFWHRLCSWVWLPFAYHSGIKICKGSSNTFSAILPFRRFNRNWYSAMAGGALLGNSEVAGGMYVFSKCGADYTVVCKHMEYTFLRPCVGPAVYRVEPREDIEEQLKAGGEFNITLDMQVYQMVYSDRREPRVGKCTTTFHVTPKTQERLRKQRRKLHGSRRRRTGRSKPQHTSSSCDNGKS